MKKILAAFILCLGISTAHAEPQLVEKPIQCATPIEVINHYVLPSDLKTLFIAVTNIRTQHGTIIPVPLVVFVNPDNGRFLIMEGTQEEACVINLGDRVDFNISHDDIIAKFLENSM